MSPQKLDVSSSILLGKEVDYVGDMPESTPTVTPTAAVNDIDITETTEDTAEKEIPVIEIAKGYQFSSQSP